MHSSRSQLLLLSRLVHTHHTRVRFYNEYNTVHPSRFKITSPPQLTFPSQRRLISSRSSLEKRNGDRRMVHDFVSKRSVGMDGHQQHQRRWFRARDFRDDEEYYDDDGSGGGSGGGGGGGGGGRGDEDSPARVLAKFLKYTAEGRDKEMRRMGYKPTYDSVGYYKLYASDKMAMRKMRRDFDRYEHQVAEYEEKSPETVDSEALEQMALKEFDEFASMGMEPGIHIDEIMDVEGLDELDDEVNEFGIRKRQRQRRVNLDLLLDEAEQFLMGKRVKGYGELSNKKTSNPFRVQENVTAPGSKSSGESLKFGLDLGDDSHSELASNESYSEKSKREKMMDKNAQAIFDPDIIMTSTPPEGSTDDGQLPSEFPMFAKEEDESVYDMEDGGIELKSIDHDPFSSAESLFLDSSGSKGSNSAVEDEIYEEEDVDNEDNEDLYEDVYVSEEALAMYRSFKDELAALHEATEAPPSYLPRLQSLMWGIDQDELFDLCEGNDNLFQTESDREKERVLIDDNPSDAIKGKMFREYYQIAKAGDVVPSFGKHPVTGRITRKRILFETDVFRINRRTPVMQRVMEEMYREETSSQTVDELLEKITGKSVEEMTEEELAEAAEKMSQSDSWGQLPELEKLKSELSPQADGRVGSSTIDQDSTVEKMQVQEQQQHEKAKEAHGTGETGDQTINPKIMNFLSEITKLPPPEQFKQLDSDTRDRYKEQIKKTQDLFASLSHDERAEVMKIAMDSDFERNKLEVAQEVLQTDNLTLKQLELMNQDENLMKSPVMQKALQDAKLTASSIGELGKVIDDMIQQAARSNVDLNRLSMEKHGIDISKVLAAMGARSRTLGVDNSRPIATVDIEDQLRQMQKVSGSVSDDEVVGLLRQSGIEDESVLKTIRKALRDGKKML